MEKLTRIVLVVVLAVLGVAAIPLAVNQWSDLSHRRARVAQGARDFAFGSSALEAGDPDLAAQSLASALRAEPARQEYQDALLLTHVAQVVDEVTVLSPVDALRLQAELATAVEHTKKPGARLLAAYGRVLLARGKRDLARARFKEAVAADGKLAVPHIELGRMLIIDDQPSAAADELERALAIDPTNPDAQFLLGKVLAAQKKWDQAAEHLERAAKKLDKDPQILVALGEVQLERKKWPEAEAALEVAARLQPNQGEVQGLYANALAANNKKLAAIGKYRAAWKLTGRWSYYSRLGRLYQRIGQHEAAIRVFLELSEMRPTDPYPECQAGLSFDALGKAQVAIQHMEQCVARAEKNPEDEKMLLSARGRLEAMRASAAAARKPRGER